MREFLQKHLRRTVAVSLASILGIGAGTYAWQSHSNPSPVKASEAAQHQGQHETVSITVGSSLVSKNHALLNEGTFPNQSFTVRITPDNPAFGSCPKGKGTMTGKRITASGTVTSYNGKPQLQVGPQDKVTIE